MDGIHTYMHGINLLKERTPHPYQKIKTIRSVCDVNIETQDIMINPILSPYENHLGTFIGMEYHVDTSCVNKHAFNE